MRWWWKLSYKNNCARCAYPFLGYSMTIIASKVSSSFFFLWLLLHWKKNFFEMPPIFSHHGDTACRSLQCQGRFCSLCSTRTLGEISHHTAWEHAVRKGSIATLLGILVWIDSENLKDKDKLSTFPAGQTRWKNINLKKIQLFDRSSILLISHSNLTH